MFTVKCSILYIYNKLWGNRIFGGINLALLVANKCKRAYCASATNSQYVNFIDSRSDKEPWKWGFSQI